jgi:hypothetical protein
VPEQMKGDLQFDIFSLVRLLSIKGNSRINENASKKFPFKLFNSESDGTSNLSSEPTSIKTVATGGYVGNAFMAIALSNGRLINILILPILKMIYLYVGLEKVMYLFFEVVIGLKKMESN